MWIEQGYFNFPKSWVNAFPPVVPPKYSFKKGPLVSSDLSGDHADRLKETPVPSSFT